MSSLTVLVVEDELLIRLAIVDYLENLWFTVFEATDAESAIAILEKHSEIQLVFTDVQMPGTMDGLQLAHYVRNRWPPTAIIVCSANPRPLDDELPGHTYWVSKPFERVEMDKALVVAQRWIDYPDA